MEEDKDKLIIESDKRISYSLVFQPNHVLHIVGHLKNNKSVSAPNLENESDLGDHNGKLKT